MPSALNSFIGRERERVELRGLLSHTRLLTLTGPGGSGKTRLARELADELTGAATEVAWVELASLDAPELVSLQVAAALGVREDTTGAVAPVLVRALRDHDLIVVLDNCEHVINECATLARDLLGGCPKLRILATSREPLRIPGERVWAVPGLSLPDRHAAEATVVGASEAVQLFVDRAQAVSTSFRLTDENASTVAHIVERLDGLPLAIELAAARMRLLGAEQIAARIDDAFRVLGGGARGTPQRHRTLREAIDWSHRLLDSRERTLFERLSVFVGGFDLEAAEFVCADAQLRLTDVLDLLGGLVDKSLVVAEAHAGHARYTLLETIRQYAVERLAEGDDAERVRSRHAEYFVGFVETAERHLFVYGDDPVWFDRIDRDMGNLRAASEWCAAQREDGDGGLRLAAALEWFWFFRGRFVEAREWLDGALSRAERAAPLPHARALTARAFTALWQGDYGSTREPAERSVRLLRTLDHPRELALALCAVGTSLSLAGDANAARETLDEAVRIIRPHDPETLAYVLYWHGFAAETSGDIAAARDSYTESFEIGRRVDFKAAYAHLGLALGRLAVTERNWDPALEHITSALPVHRSMGDRLGPTIGMELLAEVAAAQGDPTRAAVLLGAASASRDRTGAAVPTPRQIGQDELIDEVRRALTPRPFEDAWERGRRLSFEAALDYALEVAASGPPPTHPAGPDVWTGSTSTGRPVALHVLALGDLRIARDGVELPPDAWTYSKPKELLLFLLLHLAGGSREAIGRALWNDAPVERVKNSFHVTMHHLRKTLGGSDWIIADGSRYRLNPVYSCEFDARTFASEVEAALDEMDGTPAAIDRLRAALAIYRGDLVECEAVGPWHLEHRDRLVRLYVDALVAFGEALMRAQQYADAAEQFQRVIVKEDLREDAYRQLMVCRARLGDAGRARRVYDRLRVALEQVNEEPESDTNRLLDRIEAGESV